MILNFYLLQVEFTTASYIVIIGIVAFLIGLAAFLVAISEINKHLLTPIRKRLDEKLFSPLEILAKEITQIKDDVNNIKNTSKEEIENLKEIIETQALNIAFLNFKDSFAFHHNTSKAYFITDENGRIEYINECFCNIFDLDSGQIEEKYFHELPFRDDRAIIRQLWRESVTERSTYENVHAFYKTNRLIHIRIKAQPFIYNSETKKFLGFIEILKENGD